MTLMDILTLLQLGVTITVAIWGIRQTFTTNRLEKEIHFLSVNLDQSIQILHRAREAIIGMHKAHVFMLEHRQLNKEFDAAYIAQFSEFSAHWAELRGLAFAINDEELLDLVNKGFSFDGLSSEQRSIVRDEAEIRGRSQHIHTRIAQLLAKTTKKA